MADIYVLTDLQKYLIKSAISNNDIGKLTKLFYYMPPEGMSYYCRSFRNEPTVEKAKELFKELTGEDVEEE